MYHVLVPVDDDEERLDRQLRALRGLPGRDELEATVLHVYEEIDTMPDEAGPDVIVSINEDIEALQGTPDTLDRAVEAIESLGIPVDVVTTQGDPEDGITEVAADVGADAILVAGRRRSPVGKAVFGSVTQGVILQSERPVIVAD